LTKRARGSVIGGAALLSLVAGIALGLLITWVLWPVEFTNADPADLRQSLKDDYVRMVSTAYALDGDLAAAERRLALLGLANSTQTFNDLIARGNESNDPSTQEALIELGTALGLKLQFVSQRPTPTISVIAAPTETVPAFTLVEHTQLGCAEEPEPAHLRFIVRDASGRDLPNVGIQIRGENSDETIYTGLKPERGVGYADYEVAPGTYSVTIVNARGETVSNLIVGEAPTNCKADRNATPRGWKLVFQLTRR